MWRSESLDFEMIVGNGDIAKSLTDREGIIFFASGVSDSKCTDKKEFLREAETLCKYIGTQKCLVYFSTISIYDKTSHYLNHKEVMEGIVKDFFMHYCIIRIGDIDFGTNPNTFLNFLRNKKKNGEPYEIRDEYKYMISRDQLTMITNSIPLVGQNEICIFGHKAKVKDLI